MTKKPIKIFAVVAFMVIGIAIAGYFLYDYADAQASRKKFADQLGTYVLDIKKTRMGSYGKDAALYQTLQITFHADSTFSMNMAVPFIYDSTGTWKAGGGGLEDWNWLYYRSNTDIQTQFDQCCLSDSTFYLNSVTPQEGQESVSKIYFKRIRPLTPDTLYTN